MLKSTFTPFFTKNITKKPPRGTKFRKLVHHAVSTITSLQSPPPVRQNTSLNPTPQLSTSFHHHLHPPPTSAYIHLPFCRKRCHYCDFPILALGSSAPPETDPRISNYIDLVRDEIEFTNVGFDSHPPLQTVFFGGGTPSLVSPRLVCSVLDTLRRKFGVCDDAEISMEMDPGTFDAGKFRDFVGLGVNRVSLGVQAFQDELLAVCGRAHGVKEVYEAIEIIGSSGVENWSVDLISSLPHQSMQMWEESLRLAIEAQPQHVSVYDLQVEQGTKFDNLYTPGIFPLPSEIESAEFYRAASRMLTNAGYIHYEISSYCKDGYECKHNYTYWKNNPFYGFGLGSASYINRKRFSRPRRLKEYQDYVQNLEKGMVDCCGDNQVDLKDLAMDTVMLSLRTARGLDLKSFAETFSGSLASALCKTYRPHIQSGHVICLDEERNIIDLDQVDKLLSNENDITRKLTYIRLSDPDGFLLSNELISLAFGVIAP